MKSSTPLRPVQETPLSSMVLFTASRIPLLNTALQRKGKSNATGVTTRWSEILSSIPWFNYDRVCDRWPVYGTSINTERISNESVSFGDSGVKIIFLGAPIQTLQNIVVKTFSLENIYRVIPKGDRKIVTENKYWTITITFCQVKNKQFLTFNNIFSLNSNVSAKGKRNIFIIHLTWSRLEGVI